MKNNSGIFDKLKHIKPKSVGITGAGLVEEGSLPSNASLPLVITPSADGVDLADWSQNNYDYILDRLNVAGGILFRGFSLSSQADFERFIASVPLKVLEYIEGATPRTKLGKDIYTSTEFPSDHAIAPHNELSYVKVWPSKICFFCETEPIAGGETPIVDCVKVFDRIRPETREKFIHKGWRLVRNYGEGLSLTWQKAFHMENKDDLERYLRSADVEFEWIGDNMLRTHQNRPSILRHPSSGKMVWFNHIAFWHVSSLSDKVREAMGDLYREEELPYNTYYGDGSAIETSVIAELNAAYLAETVSFPWRKGDLLLLDNMRVAHARACFKGARRILTAMGDPCSERGL